MRPSLRPLLVLLLALLACETGTTPIGTSGTVGASTIGTSGGSSSGATGSTGSPTTSSTGTGSGTGSTGATTSSAASSATGSSGSTGGGDVTTFRIHYPGGRGSLAIRGSQSPLTWTSGMAAGVGDPNVFVAQVRGLTGTVEWKPLLDDRTWSIGPNYAAQAGSTVDIWPHFTTGNGQVSVAFQHRSTVLGNTRGIWVYLPPTYLENSEAKLPVAYMHDGQNLFDANTAFGGNEWRIDETMDEAAGTGAFAEAIVIGVENTGARIDEYTPTRDADVGGGGRADLYMRMLVEELKPEIDRRYRTRTGAADTALIGSSLGGLVSVWGGVNRADVFGLVGALSPSTWWDDRMILGVVDGIPARAVRPLRIHVDSGDSGNSQDGVTDTRDLAAHLRTAGYVDGSTLEYLVQPGASHTEQFWAQRMPGVFKFLLGPRTR